VLVEVACLGGEVGQVQVEGSLWVCMSHAGLGASIDQSLIAMHELCPVVHTCILVLVMCDCFTKAYKPQPNRPLGYPVIIDAKTEDLRSARRAIGPQCTHPLPQCFFSFKCMSEQTILQSRHSHPL
jgi:hypothetical protein